MTRYTLLLLLGAAVCVGGMAYDEGQFAYRIRHEQVLP
jgi:hypothetical protein